MYVLIVFITYFFRWHSYIYVLINCPLLLNPASLSSVHETLVKYILYCLELHFLIFLHTTDPLFIYFSMFSLFGISITIRLKITNHLFFSVSYNSIYWRYGGGLGYIVFLIFIIWVWILLLSYLYEGLDFYTQGTHLKLLSLSFDFIIYFIPYSIFFSFDFYLLFISVVITRF